MGLVDDLGSGPIAIDTPIFIYFIEEHPKYLPIVRPIFTALNAGTLSGITSGLTLMETLVRPYRVGNLPLAEQYEALLTRSRGLRLDEVNRAIFRAAAQLRAAYNIKTPDALQLATALLAKCSVFLTNDRDFPMISAIRIVQLKNHLTGSHY